MDDDRLQEYFEICQRAYEKMMRDGTWPWATDSPNSENLIESDRNPDDV
jgi:hypothetical protein